MARMLSNRIHVSYLRPLAAQLLVVAALVALGCGPSQNAAQNTVQNAQPAAAPAAAVMKGPVVFIDGARVPPDRRDACNGIAPLRVAPEQYDTAAGDAGMLTDDFDALRKAADTLDVDVTFRDSNRACAPHLRAGVESKGHDVLTKTFTVESLPKGFEYLAGTVSILDAKPKAGEVLADPMAKRYLTKEGQPLTCDYDLMDVIDAGGARIVGETDRDVAVRTTLNAGLPPRGDPPHHVDRVKHGAQAEYPAYLRAQAGLGHAETTHVELFAPDHPITLLDHEGHVFRLREVEDALNFYRCAGAGVPAEWNIQPRPAASGRGAP